jgi:hypothetical protein
MKDSDLDLSAFDKDIDLSAFDKDTDKTTKTQAALQGAVSGATLGLGDIIQGTGIAGLSKLKQLFSPDEQAHQKMLEDTEAKTAALRDATIDKISQKYNQENAKDTPDINKLTQLLNTYNSLKEDQKKPSQVGMIADYYNAKDVAKQAREQAEQEHPLAYGAGALGGGALTGGALSNALKGATGLAKVLPGASDMRTVGGVATEGAKAGALMGFGEGQGNLLQGDINKTALETAKGAGLGAAIGGVGAKTIESLPAIAGMIKGAGQTASELPVIKNILGAAKYGWNEEGMLTNKAVKGLTKETAEEIVPQVYSKMKNASEQKQNIISKATEDGIEIKPLAIDDSINKLNNLSIDEMNSGALADKDKALELLEFYKHKYPSGIPIEDLEPLKKNLQKYSVVADTSVIKDPQIVGVMTGVSKGLEDQTKLQLGTEYQNAQKQLEAGYDFLDKTGLRNILKTPDQISKLRGTLGTEGNISEIRKEDLQRYLDTMGITPEMGDLSQLGQYVSSAKPIGHGGVGALSTLVVAPLKAAVNIGAIGAKKAYTSGFDIMKNITPDQIKEFATKLSNSTSDADKSFIGPLTKAISTSDQGRNALLYGLYQQPAFREVLKKYGVIGNE